MKELKVQGYIDNARFGKFHWTILIVCTLLMIFDGYDLFLFGVVIPVVMDEWGLTAVQAGTLAVTHYLG